MEGCVGRAWFGIPPLSANLPPQAIYQHNPDQDSCNSTIICHVRVRPSTPIPLPTASTFHPGTVARSKGRVLGAGLQDS
ncbi:hypothetical protein IF2G_07819 [Cordyceps javanica]|nr:hypothetical protein IF2G_07819 [Cordyceps javanica]